MKNPRVGVVGSRRRTDRWRVTQFINSLPKDTVIVSGGCRGVDSWAEEAATKRGLQVETHPPDYTGFSTLSYHEKCQRYYDRNKMIAKNSDSLHAFTGPDRKGGSENTIQAALGLGREVTIHDPDGNTYLSAPSPSEFLHITKGLLHDLELLPGVRRAWPYRGRIHMAVRSKQLEDVGKMLSFTIRTLRRDGGITFVQSTIQTSEAKLKQASAKNAREAYWDVQTHIEHLQHLIPTHATEDIPEFAPDIFNKPTVTDSDRCDMEDELDKYPATNLRAEEGTMGFYTKEDYDLERAQRQPNYPTTIIPDGKRPSLYNRYEDHRDDLSYAQCLNYAKSPEYVASLLQGESEVLK